jgi:hypothetical protein
MEQSKLKAEIFDIVYEQDLLRVRFAELEKLKQQKLKELKDGDKLSSKP